MVIKTKKKHTKGSNSAKKNKKIKEEKKFRKKKRCLSKKELEPPKMDECIICFTEVPININNTIFCNNIKHCLCANCKLRIIDTNKNCPMCRSHDIKYPTEYQFINIYKK